MGLLALFHDGGDSGDHVVRVCHGGTQIVLFQVEHRAVDVLAVQKNVGVRTRMRRGVGVVAERDIVQPLRIRRRKNRGEV